MVSCQHCRGEERSGPQGATPEDNPASTHTHRILDHHGPSVQFALSILSIDADSHDRRTGDFIKQREGDIERHQGVVVPRIRVLECTLATSIFCIVNNIVFENRNDV
ncbi:hypothetical protein PENSPDRAFT_386440 [Peniophora sp. CONT]|nr:hypothetical protein PENSPDRAFT_386440 [Peniophora sp. CONT]